MTGRPIVVVTGGSRGIGKALGARFADAGYDVALVARDASALAAAAKDIEAQAGIRPQTLAYDVSKPGVYAALQADLAAEGSFIDILINNAALGLSGAFAGQSGVEIEKLIALNIAATTQLTHAALTDMLPRRRGGIINVASLGGYVPGPGQAVYYASKAFVLSFTEALAYENRGTGVRIAAVAPGPVATNFHKEMRAERAPYRFLVPEMTTQRVANSVYWRFQLGQRVIVPGLLPQLMQMTLKIVPHSISARLMRLLLQTPKK